MKPENSETDPQPKLDESNNSDKEGTPFSLNFNPTTGLAQVMAESDRIDVWKKEVKTMNWCSADDDCNALTFIVDAFTLAKELDLSAQTIVESGKRGLRSVAQYVFKQAIRCGHETAEAILDTITKAVVETGMRQDGQSKLRTPVPDFYYSRKSHNFWHVTPCGVFQSVTKDMASDMLSIAGLSCQMAEDGSPSETNRHLVKVAVEKGFDAALSLAGYPTGLHTIKHTRLLVTHSYKLIEPKANQGLEGCKQILNLINGMLGDDALFLHAQLKTSYEALRDGRRTGSIACFIVGPPDCGKSLLLDHVIVPLLGGRRANAYAFLGGQSTFNDELISSEVHSIDDGSPFDSFEARKRFGNAIKEAVAAGAFWCHGKGLAARTIPIYRRLFILVNFEDLELMPELNDSLMDKISFVKANAFEMPEGCLPLPAWHDKGAREAFVAKLEGELPSYIDVLLAWQLENDLKERRFGILAYKNEDILRQVNEMSSAHEKSAVIQKAVFELGERMKTNTVEMETKELYEYVVGESDVKDRARVLFRNSRSLGSALGQLKNHPEYCQNYSVRRSNGRSIWRIIFAGKVSPRPLPEPDVAVS
jgi:hypothetical protein